MIPVMHYKIQLSGLVFAIAVALMLPACSEQKISQEQTGATTPQAAHNYTAVKNEPETRIMNSALPS